MSNYRVNAKIAANRKFAAYDEEFFQEPEADIQTDQQLKLPQPPLVKDPMGGERTSLPRDFSALPRENDILLLINRRQSRRVYSDETMDLLSLPYLLWTTQGIKSIRGNNYATLRTVPSGGARHEFETYLLVRKVEGLRQGIYHYLPMTHQLECVGEAGQWTETVASTLEGQKWAAEANVVFFWTCVPYRSEWRYSYMAHRIILVDAGYVSQNLYLACESLGLGTCAIGAFDPKACNRMLGIDGTEEFTILCSPVGTVSEKDKEKELDFYAFLKQSE